MSDPTRIEERIAALERSVAELRRLVSPEPPEPSEPDPTPAESVPGPDTWAVLNDEPADAPAPAREPGQPGRVVVRGLPREMPGDPAPGRGFDFGSAEDWLSRLGIAMLLFGVAFLFKYSIDQGWLTPTVRAAIGHATGFALLAFGHRLSREGRTLGLVLTGGAIATFYVTIFAQFQILELLSFPVAFAWMLGVTLVSFVLALRHDQPIHGLIGALGGFGTPFILDTGSENIPGLVAWSSVVLAGSIAVSQRRSWPSLHAVGAAGAWVVLGAGCASLDGPADPHASAVAAGIGIAALLGWALPTGTWFLDSNEPEPGLVLHAAAIATPLLAIFMLGEAFDWNGNQAGLAWLLAAALFASVALGLRQQATEAGEARTGLAATHGLTAVLLATLGVVVLLEGDVRFAALATEAGLLHLVAQRLGSTRLALGAHALSAVLLLHLGFRLADGVGGAPVANAQALADLLGIAALCAGLSVAKDPTLRAAYGVIAHGVALGWIQREFGDLSGGAAWVSAGWAGLGVVLLVLGLVRDQLRMRQLAMATLALVAFKILFVDLSRVDPLVRVVASMGFGATLLILGYLFPVLWRGGRPTGSRTPR